MNFFESIRLRHSHHNHSKGEGKVDNLRGLGAAPR